MNPNFSTPNPLGSFFDDMMVLRDSTSARCSSYDRTGANIDYQRLEAGETIDIANIEGAGCIRHIYFTLKTAEHYLNDLVLRMYWDGEETPSVETPLGDFFGMRYDRVRFFQSLLVSVNVGSGRHLGTIGFNSYFPMPFAKGARITVTNDGENSLRAVWSHVDYEKLASLPEGLGRFHAQWRRENPTVPVGDFPNKTLHDGVNLDGKENYLILDAKGHGNVAGLFLHIDNFAGGWYGEGDDMIFIDGEEWPPAIHGTGSEEIFGGGACPNTEYAGPYTGYLYAGNLDFAGKNSMYRFYVTDPIRFRESVRMTIEHGHANNFANDYSSTVFWYQNEPHAAFPALPSPAGRYPRKGDDRHEQARNALFEFRRRIGEFQKKGREATGRIPQAVEGLMLEFRRIERVFDDRDNERVLEECERCLPLVDNAEAELGIQKK